MRNVTAIVLSIGEKTTERAIESLKKQSLPPKEIIAIENVAPFHKALNLGASKVKTEFFVQVDSDMILDRTCLEDLRRSMRHNVGVVIGHLRDLITGRVVGVKLFRAGCFKGHQFKDVMSPDTTFADEILKDGWKTVFALKFSGKDEIKWHTFGEHRPEYTNLYTYCKFILEGGRYKTRKDFAGIRWHIENLRDSGHDKSLIAILALAQGVLIVEDKDGLRPFQYSKDVEFLERFLIAAGGSEAETPIFKAPVNFKPEEVFSDNYKLGAEFRRKNSAVSFERYVGQLLKNTRDTSALIALFGLCHGLFADDKEANNAADGYSSIQYNLLRKWITEWITRYLSVGRRHAIKGDLGGIIWYFSQLADTKYSDSLISQIFLAEGMFTAGSEDVSGRSVAASGYFDFLEDFMKGGGTCDIKSDDRCHWVQARRDIP
jgi:hypothetical protein